MSESDRRHGYVRNRVLIETERVLTPEFADAVVWLSGAQLQMLRNITQYLNRQDTYVDDYMPGYYVAPDAADYDTILEIVADLEETLMGNPNTIWGYHDAYEEHEEDLLSSPGAVTLTFSTVPAGETWRLKHITAHNGVSGGIYTNMHIDNDSYAQTLQTDGPLGAWVNAIWHGDFVMHEGDYLKVVFYSVQQDDNCFATASGYKMSIPT